MRPVAILLCTLMILSSCAPIVRPRPYIDTTLNPGLIQKRNLVYSEDLHGVVAEPKYFAEHESRNGHESALTELDVVRDESGRKFQSVDMLNERIAVEKERRTDTPGETVAGWVGSLIAAPIFIAGFVVMGVGAIAVSPYMRMKFKSQHRKTLAEFKAGIGALERGDTENAYKAFTSSLAWDPKLAQDSDVYFQLAKTDEKAGNFADATKNFRQFIEYSSRLYPDYFTRIDGGVKNSFAQLKTEFGEAEDKLKAGASAAR